MKRSFILAPTIVVCLVLIGSGNIVAKSNAGTTKLIVLQQNPNDTFLGQVVLNNEQVFSLNYGSAYKEKKTGKIYVWWKKKKYYVQRSNNPTFPYMIYDSDTRLWFYFYL